MVSADRPPSTGSPGAREISSLFSCAPWVFCSWSVCLPGSFTWKVSICLSSSRRRANCCHIHYISTPRATSADSPSTNFLADIYLWLQWGLATSTTRPRMSGRRKKRRRHVTVNDDHRDRNGRRRKWLLRRERSWEDHFHEEKTRTIQLQY